MNVGQVINNALDNGPLFNLNLELLGFVVGQSIEIVGAIVTDKDSALAFGFGVREATFGHQGTILTHFVGKAEVSTRLFGLVGELIGEDVIRTGQG